jgi:hypothetical protein
MTYQSSSPLFLLVQANKISQESAQNFLDVLSSNNLSFEDLQAIPDQLLVQFISQANLGLNLVEQMHIASVIRTPFRNCVFEIKDLLSEMTQLYEKKNHVEEKTKKSDKKKFKSSPHEKKKS